MKPQIDKLNTGMAGEYLVAGQLCLRGWTATLTYKNYPGVDILGMHPQLGEKNVTLLQVKSSAYPSFWVGVKHSQRDQMNTLIKGPYVLVYFNRKRDEIKPAFFILTKQQIMDVVNQSDDAWRAKSHSKPLAPDYLIRIYIERDKLNKYKDQWDSLLSKD